MNEEEICPKQIFDEYLRLTERDTETFPHHLNFLNPKSAQTLLKRVGFDLLQTSTPGKLDLDTLYNNQQHIKDRFWRAFCYSGNGG